MKRFFLRTVAVVLLLSAYHTAGCQVTDSIDVVDYHLQLDLSQGTPFAGEALVTLRKTEACDEFGLSLVGTADTVMIDGMLLQTPDLAHLPIAGYAVGDTVRVRVCYHGRGYVEDYGYGGFHFDNDMTYNFGVAFDEDPHVFGRATFPCRDNFTDKATYTLCIKTKAGWTAQCSGMLQSRTFDADNSEHTVWRLEQPTPTYLVSVSQAAFSLIEKSCRGLHGTYSVTLGFTTQDSAEVQRAFALLDTVVPMYERCFGPYRWGRIGYIATRKGSMEHANNIALSREFMAAMSLRAQSTIAHELGHAWFGNLITCSDEGDMWINEGGASFCAGVSREAVSGRQASNHYYQQNLESVLRTTHITDGDYRPLYDIPHNFTYGSTVYDKGELVWHSLRGYLGDELFYSCMRRLMASCAFGNLNSIQLRDSLSLYSGVDLTDFFRFHVFSPGFVEYHLSSLLYPETSGTACGITIRQQSIGTDSVAHSNRVPVTFFARDGRQVKRWLLFDGQDTTFLFTDLPFRPDYCVLDSECEISDAATCEHSDIAQVRNYYYTNTHMQLRPAHAIDSTSVWVEHHWGKPYGLDTVAGVQRTPFRYWVVNGNLDRNSAIEGRFAFCGNASNVSYPFLDRGFYTKLRSLDSIMLFYRPTTESTWRAVSHQRTGGDYDGFFVVSNLLPGEYALAVADTAQLVGINQPNDKTPHSLFPNPLPQGGELQISMEEGENFDVVIIDVNGRQVWQKQHCSNGQPLRPNLSAGTYLVQIKNNFLSLQSILIQL